jgi:hypothetical protein
MHEDGRIVLSDFELARDATVSRGGVMSSLSSVAAPTGPSSDRAAASVSGAASAQDPSYLVEDDEDDLDRTKSRSGTSGFMAPEVLYLAAYCLEICVNFCSIEIVVWAVFKLLHVTRL